MVETHSQVYRGRYPSNTQEAFRRDADDWAEHGWVPISQHWESETELEVTYARVGAYDTGAESGVGGVSRILTTVRTEGTWYAVIVLGILAAVAGAVVAVAMTGRVISF